MPLGGTHPTSLKGVSAGRPFCRAPDARARERHHTPRLLDQLHQRSDLQTGTYA